MGEATRHHTERLIKIFCKSVPTCNSKKKARQLTIWLPLLAEGMDIHGREDVGMYFTQVLPRVLAAGQDRMRVPVSPVQRVPKKCQSKGMWKGAFNHCLPNRAQGRKWMLRHNSCNSFALNTASVRRSLSTVDQNFVFIHLWETKPAHTFRNDMKEQRRNSTLRLPRDADWNPYLDLWILLIIFWTVHYLQGSLPPREAGGTPADFMQVWLLPADKPCSPISASVDFRQGN